MLRKIFILPIRAYQILISPILGKNCRFEPTCSQYMIDAIKIWGPFKGVYLGVVRISKCHPWGPHGHDPVPEKSKSIRHKAGKVKKKQLPIHNSQKS